MGQIRPGRASCSLGQAGICMHLNGPRRAGCFRTVQSTNYHHHHHLYYIFTEHQVFTCVDLHTVFPLHTGNNKHNRIFTKLTSQVYCTITELLLTIILNAMHIIIHRQNILPFSLGSIVSFVGNF